MLSIFLWEYSLINKAKGFLHLLLVIFDAKGQWRVTFSSASTSISGQQWSGSLFASKHAGRRKIKISANNWSWKYDACEDGRLQTEDIRKPRINSIMTSKHTLANMPIKRISQSIKSTLLHSIDLRLYVSCFQLACNVLVLKRQLQSNVVYSLSPQRKTI